MLLSAVSTLPLASSTATVTAGVMAEPAAVLVGLLDEGQLRRRARVMVKADDVAAVCVGVLDA